MSGRKKGRRRPGHDRRGSADADGVTVTVCRGCCCGTRAKHPDVDHDAQLAQLRSGVRAAGGRARVVDCLDACEHSNVVVVAPSPAARRDGARPVWLGEVLDLDTTAEIIDWVQAGSPGDTAPPDGLDLHVFSPSRRVRQSAEG